MTTTLDKIQAKLQAIRSINRKKDVVSYKDLDDEGMMILLNLIEYLKTTNYTTFSISRTARALGIEWPKIMDSFHLLINAKVFLLFKETEYPIGTAKIYRVDWPQLDAYFNEIDGWVNKNASGAKLKWLMNNQPSLEELETPVDKFQKHRCQS